MNPCAARHLYLMIVLFSDRLSLKTCHEPDPRGHPQERRRYV